VFRNPINGNQASTSGVDLKYNGLYETAVGDFDVNFSTVIMDEYESEASLMVLLLTMLVLLQFLK